MFFSQQVKRNVIITNKNVKYKLTDELPNDEGLRKISKLHGIIQVYKLLPKRKMLSMLARNYQKLGIDFFP